jgi:hypothetical protein
MSAMKKIFAISALVTITVFANSQVASGQG